MSRIALLGTTLIALFGLITGGVMVGSRQQSAPTVLTLLRLTDCEAPCWIGIEPGKTSITEAKRKVIQTFGGAESGFNLEFGDAINPHVLWINLQRRASPNGITQVVIDTHFGSIVQTITFDFESLYLTAQPSIAELFERYGTPQRIALPDVILNRLSVAFLYGDETRGMVFFGVPLNFPPWEQPVRTMVFYANGQEPIPPSSRVRPWHGFESDYSAPRTRVR